MEFNGKTVTAFTQPEYEALPIAGGVMQGDLKMDGHKVTELPEPTADSDAATKAYSDAMLQAAVAHAEDIRRTIPIMGIESWECAVTAGNSVTHICAGYVAAVFVTILTKQGHKVSGFWTPNTSGMIDQFLSGETDGQKSYYTTVDIAGEHVTVHAVHKDNTYYVTAFIRTTAMQ